MKRRTSFRIRSIICRADIGEGRIQEETLDALHAVLFLLQIHRIGEAVGKHDQRITRFQQHFALFVQGIFAHTERKGNAGRVECLQGPVRPEDWTRLAGI